MLDKWGRVVPFSIEADRNGKPLKAKTVLGYSTRPFPGDDLQEYGYCFSFKAGKTTVDVQFSRSQVEEMLIEMGEREVEDIEERTPEPYGDCGALTFDIPDEDEDEEFDWDKFFADMASPLPEPEPEKKAETDDVKALNEALDRLLLSFQYPPTADQQKASDLLNGWGFKGIEYSADKHRVRAEGSSGPIVWHALGVIAHANDPLVPATKCPECGDTFAENFPTIADE